ncbi:MAG: hypothetical protein C0618_02795 [Desulfuromonas sp.]|nr:MAG: hypothetical protein C0618_02795 [Desulfuromonas sp.]
MPFLRTAVLLLSVFSIVSCAPVMQPPLGPLSDQSGAIPAGKYVSKVDNLQVILDASLSMDEGGRNDFLPARDIVRRFNQTLPADFSARTGLRSFGHHDSQSSKDSALLYGMSSYSRSAFHDGLARIHYTGGPSPLAAALDSAAEDLRGAGGSSAVVVVSDGLHMDGAVDAAKALKRQLGKNACLYTIAIGNENNGAGQDLLSEVAAAGECGYATTDAALATDANMTAFVQKALLTTPVPVKKKKMVTPVISKPIVKTVPPADTDGDGVVDTKDKCPATPSGEMVDENGCTLKLTLHVNFDSNRAEIKPEFKVELDKAAAYIQKYKNIPYIIIAGYTDSRGAAAYNQKLSERRAEAVLNALVKDYGIDGKRLEAYGYGMDRPVASNQTAEGRYQNRRVEIICCVARPK